MVDTVLQACQIEVATSRFKVTLDNMTVREIAVIQRLGGIIEYRESIDRQIKAGETQLTATFTVILSDKNSNTAILRAMNIID